jgi:hypothetical protein
MSNLCEFIEDESPVAGIVCIKCEEEKPLSHFSQMKYQTGKSSSEIKRTCKDCRNKATRIRGQLKKENPMPSRKEPCPSCGYTLEYLGRLGQSVFKKWRLHHCHKTGKFLGYICHKCNQGFGAFNDNPDQMQRALNWQKERLENV